MLGDITIAEPKADIEFVGKRMIEHTLRDDFEVFDSLFDHGLLYLIIPCNLLKGVLNEIFELYDLAPHIHRECNPKIFYCYQIILTIT
jgi:acetyl-CoA carboxylase beta subunit